MQDEVGTDLKLRSSKQSRIRGQQPVWLPQARCGDRQRAFHSGMQEPHLLLCRVRVEGTRACPEASCVPLSGSQVAW